MRALLLLPPAARAARGAGTVRAARERVRNDCSTAKPIAAIAGLLLFICCTQSHVCAYVLGLVKHTHVRSHVETYPRRV